jgi:DNA-3-methyladenine glycosylase
LNGLARRAVGGAARALDPAALLPGAEVAARRLLGCHLVSTIGGHPVGGRIVETEAYVGRLDPASHARERIGRTRRNSPMFGPPGTAYVYFVYGMHWCFNVVAATEGEPEAVLVRALEPLFGEDLMRERRGGARDLTNGPARLCAALGIDGSLNGHRLSEAPLVILEAPSRGEDDVAVSGRIGVREAESWPLRFFYRGHPHVSRAKGADAAPRSVLPRAQGGPPRYGTGSTWRPSAHTSK